MKHTELIYARHNRGILAPKIDPSHIGFCELTVVFDGTLEYTVDGTVLRLTAGDMLYISKGSFRSRSVSKEAADYISFNFLTTEEIGLPRVLRGAVCGEIVLLTAAYDKMETRAYSDQTEKYVHLLACIISVLEEIAASAQISPLTKRIMEYIHSNLCRRITLADIGHQTFFSPIYCDTVFKRETGRSIIDYVIDRRIDEAKKLLLEGSMTLAQVAEAVGFADYNYFSRVFRKRSGYTPGAYKRMTLPPEKRT